MKVHFTGAAQKEYVDAIEYYNSLRDGLGYEFALEIDKGIENIHKYPAAWQKLSDTVTRYLIKRFPYGIMYTECKDSIIVLSIMNLRKKPKKWNDLK